MSAARSRTDVMSAINEFLVSLNGVPDVSTHETSLLGSEGIDSLALLELLINLELKYEVQLGLPELDPALYTTVGDVVTRFAEEP